MREFDERVSHLKNENVELHKRIDQLEALVNRVSEEKHISSVQLHVVSIIYD
jgi:hypothetical protein